MSIKELRNEYFKDNFGEDPISPDVEVVIDDVAVGGVKRMDDHDCLVGIFVHPDHRGEGHGNALVEQLESHCEGTIRLVTFWCMEEAMALYAKHGYGVVECDFDKVTMEKNNGCKQT